MYKNVIELAQTHDAQNYFVRDGNRAVGIETIQQPAANGGVSEKYYLYSSYMDSTGKYIRNFTTCGVMIIVYIIGATITSIIALSVLASFKVDIDKKDASLLESKVVAAAALSECTSETISGLKSLVAEKDAEILKAKVATAAASTNCQSQLITTLEGRLNACKATCIKLNGSNCDF